MYQDKLGCYRVGDLKFHSKLEAIEAHAKTGTHPRWDFNEAVFSSYNWAVEPSKSLPELYRERAQQLRDQYDYIILSFSGGADSNNILDTFIDNDIKLDEVYSLYNYETIGNRDGWLNAEIFRTARPKFEKLQQTHPWLKHRLIDITKIELEYFTNNESKFDWIYKVNTAASPNNVARENFALKIKDWADLIHAGKKVCILWGVDKPRILHENNRFSFRFLDLLVDASVQVPSIAGLQPYTDEMFYWSPDKPEIVIKQAHVVKNYLSGNLTAKPHVNRFVPGQSTFSTRKFSCAYRKINGERYWLSHDGLHELIYPTWRIGTFSCDKTDSPVLTPRDEWLFSLTEEHPIRKNWKTGLDELWKLLPDYWKNNPSSVKAGIKACWSKDYFLE